MEALTVLENQGYKQGIMTFLKLVRNNSFPLTNIVFLLYIDVIQWYSLSTTRRKCVNHRRVNRFGGRVSSFSGGGGVSTVHGRLQIQMCLSDKLHTTSINFAVPSQSVVNKFVPIECLDIYVKRIEPGVLTPIIELRVYGNKNRDVSHILTFDGKKIVPKSTEIDLLYCDENRQISLKK